MCWPATSPPSSGWSASGPCTRCGSPSGARGRPSRAAAMDSILHLISRYGYLIILFGVMAESTGVPLPGETILISAGILVQRGSLDLGDAIFFGILGAIVGDQLGYWAGREGGRPFILRYGRYVWITPERLGRAEAFFARHGGKAVFMARFFSGLRVFGALVAGMSRMPWGTFILYNALGGAIWATAAVLVGYFLGSSLGVVDRWTGQASILLLALAVLALVLYLSYRWVMRHQEQVKGAFERIGGHRVYAFLESPVGLWLRRRFSPTGVYGLTLTLGLVLTGLFSWAFGGVVQDVVARDPLVRTDLAVLRFIHSHGEPYLTAGVNVLEAIVSPEVLFSVAALAGFALLLLGRGRGDFEVRFSGIVLLATALGTGALAGLFELLFYRPRPPSPLQLVHETGYGSRVPTPLRWSPSGLPSGTCSAFVPSNAGAAPGGPGRGSGWPSWLSRCWSASGACTQGRTTPATCWPGGPSG